MAIGSERMTKKEAEAKLREARAVLAAHEDAERRAKGASLIGRCFRYRNCYSCPQSEADYWWLYLRVTDMNEHGSLQGWSFQTDKDGRVSVWAREHILSELVSSDGYKEIPQAEFDRAYGDLLRGLQERHADLPACWR
jgi:hypothetical protein